MPAALSTPLPLAISGPEIFIALVFVVGGLIKHLLERASGRNADTAPSQRTPPLVPPRPITTLPPRPLATPEEERARRLMEALGQSGRADAPPVIPPVAPRPLPTPPTTVTRKAPPPVPPPLPPFLPPVPDPVLTGRRVAPNFPREPDPAPSSRRAPVRPPSSPPATALATNRRGLLNTASRGDLRRAILLREVLGPPRALSEPGGAFM